MVEPHCDFVTDPDGPRGIAVDSGVWTADGGGSYYYPRLSDEVLPNLLRLIRAFRSLKRPVVYRRIASLNPNLLDVPGLSRRVVAGSTPAGRAPQPRRARGASQPGARAGRKHRDGPRHRDRPAVRAGATSAPRRSGR
jgi:nicotinamidase-related amidase